MATLFRIAFAVAGWLALSGGAHAVAVNCAANQTLSAAIKALPPSTDYQNVTLSGACAEAVTIPPGLAVAITGASGASVTAPTGASGFYVLGKLAVTNVTVKGSNVAAIYADQGAYLSATALRVSGGDDGVDFAHGASGQIVNSTIVVNGSEAVGNFGGGAVEIDGSSPVGGLAGTTLQGQSYGLNCGPGSASLNAFGGSITILNAGVAGVQAGPCSITTAVGANSHILIRNNFLGVFSKVGGSVTLTGDVSLLNNTNSAINAQQNGVVSLFNFGAGANTISKAATNANVLFSCYQGGKIYVAQIAGIITPAPTSADIGCLQVGGP